MFIYSKCQIGDLNEIMPDKAGILTQLPAIASAGSTAELLFTAQNITQEKTKYPKVLTNQCYSMLPSFYEWPSFLK